MHNLFLEQVCYYFLGRSVIISFTEFEIVSVHFGDIVLTVWRYTLQNVSMF